MPGGPAKTVVSVFGIDPYRIGAGEIYARELSAQLGKRGWSSVLCYLAAPPDPVRQFLQLPNVSLEIVEDSWKNSWRPLRQLARILERYRPEILHLHFTGFLSAYPWLARLYGTRRVYFADQSSRPEGFVATRRPAWRRLLMRGINYPITKVICASEYSFHSFTALDLLPASRFVTLYNSVDIARADAGLRQRTAFRRRYGIAEDRLVVTQVSWLIPEKGIADLLAAAQIVVAREPRAHFVLVGDGSHAAEYKRLAAESGLSEHVTFTGVVVDPLAEGVYAAADVACLVSRWEECFGYVTAEAMASYVPVVGTRVGGTPELIEDGRTGFLTARGNVAAIAERIVWLLQNPARRAEMGRAGRRAVEEKFNHKINLAWLLELYGLAPAFVPAALAAHS
jgi:glycosyltransferase involved in cell wall biosynthesis